MTNIVKKIPLLTAAFLCLVSPAFAHAILLKATPAEKSTVTGPNIPVELKFNSRIDGKRSRLSVILPGDAQHPVENQQQIAPDTLTGEVKGLKPGSYKLRWQVLATDGHITVGLVPFIVQ